jgi:hypothetical protein
MEFYGITTLKWIDKKGPISVILAILFACFMPKEK